MSVIISMIVSVFTGIINRQLETPGITTTIIKNEGPFNIETDTDDALEHLFGVQHNRGKKGS